MDRFCQILSTPVKINYKKGFLPRKYVQCEELGYEWQHAGKIWFEGSGHHCRKGQRTEAEIFWGELPGTAGPGKEHNRPILGQAGAGISALGQAGTM